LVVEVIVECMTTLERPLLLLGDCLEQLRELPDNSVDSVVTDPPYGLSFMGKKWDYDVPSVEVWAECLRVLKPGGHLLAFAGTRTQHRMAVRIEDAGFEIRDMIAWVYGSGFPKSLDVSKAIDKAAGAEREVVGPATVGGKGQGNAYGTITRPPATAPATAWQGWGTALKPALEPITVARKPLSGTVASNVLEHGTGAINVDGCRVGTNPDVDDPRLGGKGKWKTDKAAHNVYEGGYAGQDIASSPLGRWPANLILDGSEEVVGLFPVTTSGGEDKHGRKASTFCASTGWEDFKGTSNGGDTGSAARFFYCAKASKRDRDEGLDGFEFRPSYMVENGSKTAAASNGVRYDRTTMQRNNHPTVKPTDLMRYLCRLVTPPEGIVLDPFAGSGSTGKAAILEGFRFIGIERDEEYMKIAEARIAAAIDSKKELLI
jgi:DNA modification methylase